MTEEIPYDGAKPMYFVEDVDNKEKLAEIVNTTVKGLTSKEDHSWARKARFYEARRRRRQLVLLFPRIHSTRVK